VLNALLRSASLLAVVALAACGGGGGGGGGTGGPPPVQIANTSSPFFLPSKAGNRWVFSSGGSFNDVGRFTVSCTCAINGLPNEGMDIRDPSGTYSSTFYFAKTTSTQTSGTLDTFIALSSDHGATVQFITDGNGNYGLPVNDSAAFVGEHWTNSGETSTETAVNGTQPYNAQIIQNVNTDQFSGPQLNLTWGFARGVGFTSLSMSGQTVTLSSFTIDVAGSQSVGRSSLRTLRATGTATPTAALARLSALF
jgi:hypothetical protein